MEKKKVIKKIYLTKQIKIYDKTLKYISVHVFK